MLIRLGEMFFSLLKPLNFKAITADILFILILVELFRLLIIYLQEQRISVGAAVEVSLVSALREVVVEGVLEIPIEKILGVCAFLVVLGSERSTRSSKRNSKGDRVEIAFNNLKEKLGGFFERISS